MSFNVEAVRSYLLMIFQNEPKIFLTFSLNNVILFDKYLNFILRTSSRIF